MASFKYAPLAAAALLVTTSAIAAPPDFVKGQVVVNGAPSEFTSYDVVKYLPNANLTVLSVEPGREFGAVQALNARGRRASLNFVVTASDLPNDFSNVYQWNFESVQGPSAWTNYDASATQIVVAVLDTGLNQVGFNDGVEVCDKPGLNTLNNTSDTMDDRYHGTHVSGTIAQITNNSVGLTGLAYNACILPVKVLAADGSGTSADLAEGIVWAGSNADVINMSLGYGRVRADRFTGDPTWKALNEVPEKVIIVAASGNEGWSSVSYPASHPSVISVGATDSANRIASFSNKGSDLNLVAPGVDILQEAYVAPELNPGGESGWSYWYLSGTSMASPHVAAAAAILKASDPGLTRSEVLDLLQSTALDLGTAGFDTTYGYGLIQVADAVAALNGGVNPPSPPPVINEAPTAIISTPVCTGLSCTFSGGNSTDPDGTIVSYVWKYGSQVIAQGVSPTVGFVAGTYTITLEVTDNDGATDTDSTSVTVSASGSDNTAPVISGLSESSRKKNFSIEWSTDEPATSVVTFQGLTYGDSTYVTSHKVTIQGAYNSSQCSVSSADQAGNVSSVACP